MFIESCEVQLSSAIVVSMLQYLIQSLQKHAQNMSIQLIHRMEKRGKKISRVLFMLSFSDIVQPEVHHCQEFKFFKKRKGAVIQRERESQVEMVLQ